MIDEQYDENEPLKLFDPSEPWKKTVLDAGSYVLRELMLPIFVNGDCVYKSSPVMAIRDYCQQELGTLWDETRRFVNPHLVYVDLSQSLYDEKMRLLGEMNHG
jgi:nicotinate phosphoribosyltransferase